MRRTALQPAQCRCAACRSAAGHVPDRAAAPAPAAAALRARPEVSLAAARLGHRLESVPIAPPAAAGYAAAPARSEAIQASLAEERPSGEHLAPAGRGKPLPEAVRGKMERAFGHDFSRVRIHEGGTSESLGAIAFTRGQDVHFAPGRYSPASRAGQELLGHELAHVVQQAHGRVALPQGKGAPINADPALEAEADLMGRQAARGLLGRGHDGEAAGEGGAGSAGRGPAAIQRQDGEEENPLLRGARGVGGLGYSGFVGRNVLLQYLASTGRRSPEASSRLGAFVATQHFRPGEVGFGAHSGIQGIHSLLGGIGQSNIGSLFGGPVGQHLGGQSLHSPANLELGTLEHSFWRDRLYGTGASGPSTAGERFGGLLGTSVFPRPRALIQAGLGQARAVAPRLVARVPPVAGILAGLTTAHSALPEEYQFRRRSSH